MMNKNLLKLTSILILALAVNAEAKTNSKKASKAAKAQTAQTEDVGMDEIAVPGRKPKSKTEHDFSDFNIKGKYQVPDESLIKVDEDKLLSDLIGYRKNFDDRNERLKSQNSGL